VTLAFLVLAALAATPPADSTAASPDDNQPFWTGTPDAAGFDRGVRRRLDHARSTLAGLLAAEGRRTVANTLRPYDAIMRDLDRAGGEAGLIQVVHPDSAMRGVAETAKRDVEALATEISLDRGLYDALRAVDTAGLDSETRFYLSRTLRDFRLAGVDRDEATRARVRALRDELVQIGQQFSRNIVGDVRRVTVDSPEELSGLPADYVAAHPPGPDGKIVLTTDYPDAYPVFSYARSDDLRRRMRVAFDSRAYPANMPLLDRLIARRAELAKLLGFASWADYATADKMVGSAAKASAFIDRVAEASREAAGREYDALLERKRRDDPAATVVNRWERSYLEELVRRERYRFDSQRAREYFPYAAVKQGVLDVSARLFGVTFRPMRDPPVWDRSVEGWEMLEGGKLVGRFYLDMHPREGKFKHAAQFDIRNGVAGALLPEAALVCNFPGGVAGDPGLMEHSEVETFFHEFGHLMHNLLGGRQRWVGLNPSRVEYDFIEAPSQMLEEWTWDPVVLARFARHYRTGEPIPAELVRQMKRGSDFGRALDVRQQMAYARLSLSLYDRPPAEVNTDSLAWASTRAYTPFPPVPGTHYQTSFGHLDGYSAFYYTYMWSLVIAKDLFSGFDRKDLLAAGPARRYREAVLAPGGSAPVDTLIRRFLGRPLRFEAWQRWLESGE
jgi:thimet oligopeptidase